MTKVKTSRRNEKHGRVGKPMVLKPEKWRSVPGFEPYQVSSLGRICRADRLLKLTKDSTGYLYVDFCLEGKHHKTAVHTAVALAFVGPRPTRKHQVAHSDGSRTNNRPSNISWKTARENASDRSKHGRTCRGSAHGMSFLSARDVKHIRKIYVRSSKLFGSVALSKQYGVSQTQIWRIIHGYSWGCLS